MEFLHFLGILVDASGYLLVGRFRFVHLVDSTLVLLFLPFELLNGLTQVFVLLEDLVQRSLRGLVGVGVLEVAVWVLCVDYASIRNA